jgi:hypothetical protein
MGGFGSTTQIFPKEAPTLQNQQPPRQVRSRKLSRHHLIRGTRQKAEIAVELADEGYRELRVRKTPCVSTTRTCSQPSALAIPLQINFRAFSAEWPNLRITTARTVFQNFVPG